MPRLLTCALFFGFSASALGQEAPAPAPVADQEILDELKSAPLSNEDRVQRLKALYEQAGAPPESIRLQPVKGRRETDPLLHNVIVTKPGKTDLVIVVGGHLDKVAKGTGVIDDWSGASLAANLYQAIKNIETKHTFIFMGFAYEEQGLVGSRLYVDSLTAEEKSRVAAMINLECLGVGGPFLWTNGSTDSLEAIAHRVAKEHDLPLEDHVIQGVGADSIPFDRAGIPNLTFDGLPREKFGFIHSDEDKFENVDTERYLNAFRLVSRYLLAIDAEWTRPEPQPAAEPEMPAEPKKTETPR